MAGRPVVGYIGNYTLSRQVLMVTDTSPSTPSGPGEPKHYPTPGSLGEFVQGNSRSGLDNLLIPIKSAPSIVPDLPGRVRQFLSLHERMAGSVPRDANVRSFRGVPSGRHVAELEWYDPENDAFVSAHHPSGYRRPASVTVLARVDAGDSLSTVVGDLGYPVPAKPPSVVIGAVDRSEGLTLVYAPGPPNLAELTYRIVGLSGARYVATTAERPPEPRFGELRECYRSVFSESRSLIYEDRDDIRANVVREASLDAGGPSIFGHLS